MNSQIQLQAKKNPVYKKLPQNLVWLISFRQKIKVAKLQDIATLIISVQKQLARLQTNVHWMERDNQIKSETWLRLNEIKIEIKNKIWQIYKKDQNVNFRGLGQRIRNLAQQKVNLGILNLMENIKSPQFLCNILKPQCIGCIPKVNQNCLIYIQKQKLQHNLEFFDVVQAKLSSLQKQKIYPRMCRLLNSKGGGYIMIGLQKKSNNIYKPQGLQITNQSQETWIQQIRAICKYASISFIPIIPIIPIIQTRQQNVQSKKKPIQTKYLIRIECRPDPCIYSGYGILKTPQSKTIIGLDQFQKWLYLFQTERNYQNTLTIYRDDPNQKEIEINCKQNRYMVEEFMVQKIHSDFKKRRINTNKHRHIQTSLGILGKSNDKKEQKIKKKFLYETYVHHSQQPNYLSNILKQLDQQAILRQINVVNAKQNYKPTNTIISKNAWIIQHNVCHQQLQKVILQKINRQNFIKFLQIVPILKCLHIKGYKQYMKIEKELQNQLQKQKTAIKNMQVNKLYNDKHEDKNYQTELHFNNKRESLLAYVFLKLKKLQVAFGV